MELFGITSFLQAILIFTVSVFLCWFLYMQIEFHVRRIPPGPIGVPILGYTLFLTGDKLHEEFAELNRKYGKICSVTAATVRLVIVSDFDTTRELLCHPATLFRPAQVFDFLPGKGGFSTMNGKQWLDERKFGMQAMRNIGLGGAAWNDIIQEDVSELMTIISSTNGKPIDIDTVLSTSAMNNVLALIMGRQYQTSLGEHDFEIFCETDKIFKKHFQKMGLWLTFPWLLNYVVKLNIDGYAKKMKVVAASAEILRKEIKNRIKSAEYEANTDFVKEYMEEVKKHNPSIKNVESHIESCLGDLALFISGSNSSMALTHWMMYFMAAHPEKQARVQTELDDVMGKDGVISWDARDKLPYSMACLMEMQRWVVVIPLFPPRCARETFEFHSYTIPKGTLIIANGWALNRDPKYFDNPDEYMPERFLQGKDGKPSKVDGYAPFSFGRRNCPGEKVTLMIAFMYFTNILQKFTVRTPSGDPPSLELRYCGIFEPVIQPLCFYERE